MEVKTKSFRIWLHAVIARQFGPCRTPAQPRPRDNTTTWRRPDQARRLSSSSHVYSAGDVYLGQNFFRITKRGHLPPFSRMVPPKNAILHVRLNPRSADAAPTPMRLRYGAFRSSSPEGAFVCQAASRLLPNRTQQNREQTEGLRNGAKPSARARARHGDRDLHGHPRRNLQLRMAIQPSPHA
jgi:hypothetical protein